MTNLPPPAASATEPLGSVALAALSAGAPVEQREAARAALQYLASLYNLTPAAPAPSSVATPAPAPVPASPAPPVLTSAPPTPAPTVPVNALTTWTAGYLYNQVPTAHLASVFDNGEGWYAVIKGRTVGITQDHPLALNAVVGVSNNAMKSYKTLSAALFKFNHALDIGLVEVLSH
ncbi:hypothetical protein B0H11DRAFT_2247750 [Mycena galericulata]|nr:hypothetical protein B0H11DRAFT_1943696 [Mycena galericulata]KAJ7448451.1 hypothetical protein B0H11DRAFT_1929117 [Mycena galericulata]KAJ7448463.1 hypothetical protein B0H11DRAFT_2247750 [Mycena galericulata]